MMLHSRSPSHRSPRLVLVSAVLLAGGLLAACPAKTGVGKLTNGVRESGPPKPQVISFSELHPVTALAEFNGRVYVGDATGLRAYEKGKREPKVVVGPDQRPFGRVHAASGGVGGLWVVTDRGLFNRHRTGWRAVPKGTPREARTVLTTSDGVLVGASGGLFLLAKGRWKRLLPGAKISLLVDNRAGRGAWVGTDGEGLYAFAKGQLTVHAVDSGQPIRRVRALTYTKAGGVLAVGADGQGRDLLAYYDGTHWTAYWPPRAVEIGFLTQIGGRVLVGVGKRVLEIHRAAKDQKPATALELSGERSPTAPRDYPIPHYYATVVRRVMPTAPTVVLDRGDHVLLGTARQGVASFDGKRLRWYRSESFTGSARRLKTGCTAKGCFVAFDGKGYFGDGRGFRRAYPSPDPSARVQGFMDDGRGHVWAIHTRGNAPTALVISELSASGFSVMTSVEVRVPHGGPVVRYIRRGPKGGFWIGLGYRDAQGEARAWGIVVINRDGSSLYHRSSMLPDDDRPVGSLALPDDLRDVCFHGGDLWLATGSGIYHVIGQKIVQITENEGLASELVYALSTTRPKKDKPEVLVGTYAGLGRRGPTYWHFDYPAPLNQTVRAMIHVGDTLVAATSRGVAELRGEGKARSLKVVTTEQGLASDDVYDLRRAPSGELWALTAGGLSIIGGPTRKLPPWGAPTVLGVPSTPPKPTVTKPITSKGAAVKTPPAKPKGALPTAKKVAPMKKKAAPMKKKAAPMKKKAAPMKKKAAPMKKKAAPKITKTK